MADEIKTRLMADMKAAMKSGDKRRLGTIRLAQAEIKRREVDERVPMSEDAVLALVDKMVKQRRDSLAQFEQAGRKDLAEQEGFEIEVLQEYLPAALSEAELDSIVSDAIAASGASSMKDMGKVMGIVRPKVQGRADMGAVSGKIKAALS